jgi:hydrogenase maturation factor
MNLIFGEVISVFTEDGMRVGRIRVSGGVIRRASLELLTDAAPGAEVLICDGVAISKVEPNTETDHVPCHSR